MTDIKTVLVHIDFHETSLRRVQYAAGVASRFGATLIGVSACQMPSVAPSIGGKRFATFERSEIEEELAKREAEFKAAVPAGIRSDWRGLVGSPMHVVADEGHRADIIVASSHKGSDLSESDVGDLAMIAGRPVLVPADGVDNFTARSVMVAWKNTREARRAIGDALPILAKADAVRVLAVVGKDKGDSALDGVLEYLAHHGVRAEPTLIDRDRTHPGEVLIREAANVNADLVVAGAYGHSRFRELAFGGITRDLLHQTALSVLLSN